MISDNKYIIPVTATVEKDSKTGYSFIIVKVTNPFIKELKSAEECYIGFKKETMSSDDPTDIKEMEISKQIRDEIHSIWKVLNPS